MHVRCVLVRFGAEDLFWQRKLLFNGFGLCLQRCVTHRNRIAFGTEESIALAAGDLHPFDAWFADVFECFGGEGYVFTVAVCPVKTLADTGCVFDGAVASGAAVWDLNKSMSGNTRGRM